MISIPGGLPVQEAPQDPFSRCVGRRSVYLPLPRPTGPRPSSVPQDHPRAADHGAVGAAPGRAVRRLVQYGAQAEHLEHVAPALECLGPLCARAWCLRRTSLAAWSRHRAPRTVSAPATTAERFSPQRLCRANLRHWRTSGSGIAACTRCWASNNAVDLSCCRRPSTPPTRRTWPESVTRDGYG